MSQDVKICGEEMYKEAYVKALWIIYEVFLVSAGLYLCYKWFKNRNTFPLMERSPYLSIYFLINVMIYLLSYPIFLQSDFLQKHENSIILKCIFIPFQGSYTYIYLLKSCRLSWGFYIKREGILKKFEQKINYCFAKEHILLLICFGFFIFNITTGIIPSSSYNQFDFMAINIEDKDIYILLARMIENYFGLTYLFLSLWMARKVDRRVSIIYELYLIIISDLITTSIRHILMMTNLEIARNFCINNSIPLLYLINWIKLTTTLVVGMVRPLKMINREHQYYNSILIKNIEFFLFYKPDIFQKFLEYCREKSQKMQIRQNLFIRTHSNTSNLQGQSLSSPLQNSPQNIISQPVQDQNQNPHNNSPFYLNNQHSSNNDNGPHNQNTSSCQDSSLSNPSQAILSSRELFLRRFNYEFVLGHLKIYLQGEKLKEIREKLRDNQKYEEDFKQYIQSLRQNDQFDNLFSKNKELQQQIYYWLNIDSFTSGINRNGNTNQNKEALSSSCLGNLGTLYHSNQQQSSESGCSQEEYYGRRQIETSTIIQNILTYSEEILQPIYNEYKMTHSFQEIQQEIKYLLQAYTNLLQIKMAVDQHIIIQ